MHVAVTGVSGFIGSFTARHLKEAGHTVTGLVRGSSRRDHVESVVARFVEGNQDDEDVWDELLEGTDCVVHNSFDWTPLRSEDVARHLQSNLLASIRLLHASKPRQFIYVSSVAVHHDIRPRWQGKIDADHPVRPASLYGACKGAVEAHLWAEHFGRGRSVSAIRPCAVYGLDPKLSRSIGYPIVEQISHEQRYDRAGGGKFVHVDDVAATITACVGNASASGKAIDLADCYARWADWAAIAADVLGVEADIDMSSAAQPKNRFSKEAARSLGIALNRGHDGIRAHLRELIEVMERVGTGSQ